MWLQGSVFSLFENGSKLTKKKKKSTKIIKLESVAARIARGKKILNYFVAVACLLFVFNKQNKKHETTLYIIFNFPRQAFYSLNTHARF